MRHRVLLADLILGSGSGVPVCGGCLSLLLPEKPYLGAWRRCCRRRHIPHEGLTTPAAFGATSSCLVASSSRMLHRHTRGANYADTRWSRFEICSAAFVHSTGDVPRQGIESLPRSALVCRHQRISCDWNQSQETLGPDSHHGFGFACLQIAGVAG